MGIIIIKLYKYPKHTTTTNNKPQTNKIQYRFNGDGKKKQDVSAEAEAVSRATQRNLPKPRRRWRRPLERHRAHGSLPLHRRLSAVVQSSSRSSLHGFRQGWIHRREGFRIARQLYRKTTLHHRLKILFLFAAWFVQLKKIVMYH